MTRTELIKKLQLYDTEMNVVIENGYENYEDFDVYVDNGILVLYCNTDNEDNFDEEEEA